MKDFVEKKDMNTTETGGDTRKPIFRQALAPFLFSLKTFGLYFESPHVSKTSNKFISILSRCYSYFVIALLFAQVGRTTSGKRLQCIQLFPFSLIAIHHCCKVFYLRMLR